MDTFPDHNMELAPSRKKRTGEQQDQKLRVGEAATRTHGLYPPRPPVKLTKGKKANKKTTVSSFGLPKLSTIPELEDPSFEFSTRGVMNKQVAATASGSCIHPVENADKNAVIVDRKRPPRKQQRKRNVHVDNTFEILSDPGAAGHTRRPGSCHNQKNDKSLDEILERIFDDDWQDIPCDCLS